MRLKKVSILNYKGFKNSGEIDLNAGLNFVVGANNAGKTAFLEAVSLRFSENPHRTVSTIPRVGVSPIRNSSVTVEFECSKQEMLDHLGASNQNFYLPIPDYKAHSDLYRGDRNNNQPDADLLWKFLLKSEQYNSEVCFENGQPVAVIDPAHGLYKSIGDGTKRSSFKYQVQSDGRVEVFGSGGERGNRDVSWLGVKLANALQGRIYQFKAERFNLARSAADANQILNPDASNLATVILNLQNNEARKRRLNTLINRVLPSIYGVSASMSPNKNGQAELVVWTHDPNTEREDLAYSLDQCGTGVSQIVAMLTVLVTSDFPTCLIIDEPNSFLHPGAVRNLLEIFQENKQHQYIISTHSPTALNSVLNANILLVEHINNESKVSKIDQNTVYDQRRLLSCVGARLSDVFGSDRVLWVEGRTEELCLPHLIAKTFPKKRLSIAILGVPDTGVIDDKKQANRAIEIYKKLATGLGLVPSALGFIFDKEKRKIEWISNFEKEHQNMVIFLARRTLENYLLHPKGIAELIGKLTGNTVNRLHDVQTWLNENERLEKYQCSEQKYDDRSILVRDIDAPSLIDDCIASLTEQKFSFKSNKAEYTAKLFEWTLVHSPESFNEIVELLKKIPLFQDEACDEYDDGE